MREKKANETVKKGWGGKIQYFDELGRNTYYYNPRSGATYEKEWVRLPNGEDRETYVEGANGYFRRHWYDIHTGELLKEIDSNGEINLINKRKEWNSKDEQISLEYRRKGRVEAGKSTELF